VPERLEAALATPVLLMSARVAARDKYWCAARREAQVSKDQRLTHGLGCNRALRGL
jgi:hypothetical protein